MADDMKGSVGLDVTAFKAGISELKASMNSVEASFRASAAVMGEWSNSTAGLSERISSLREKLGLQREALDRLHSAYTKVVEEQGADSKSAASLANQMYAMEKKISGTESSIKRYDKSLSEMKSESTRGKGALSKLGEGFQSLSKKSQSASEKIKGHFSGLKSVFSGLTSSVLGMGLGMGISGIAHGIYNLAESASNLSEAQNVVENTFKKSSKSVEDWTNTTAKSAGVGKTAAMQWSGSMGAMLQSSGVTETAAATMSEKLVQLTGDMSSFYDVGTSEMWEKIRSGISGETEPLKQLGINMSVANLSAYAMSQGIHTAYDKMTQAQQTTLRYNYLLTVTKNAQNDFARTSAGSMANQARIFKMNIAAMKQSIGAAFLPAINSMYTALNPLFQAAIPKVSAAVQGLAGRIATHKTEIVQFATAISSAVRSVVQFIVQNAPKVISIVSQVVSSIMQHKQEIITAIAAIGATIAAAGIGAKIAKVINKAKKGIQDLSGAAKAAKIFENLFGMTPQAAAAVAIIAGVAALAMVIIRNWEPISGFFKNIWSGIKSGAQVVADNVGKFFTSAANLIKSIWGGITGFFSGIWNGITSIFSVVASFFNGVFGAAVSVIKSAWSGITGFFGGIWNGIKSIFSAVGSFFSGIFGTAAAGIRSAWSGITGFFSGIWKNISGVFASVGSWFGQRFSEAQSAIKTHFQPNAITSHMHSVWTGIQGAFNDVKNWFGTKFEDAKQAIFTHFSPDAVSSKFNEVWDAVQGTFSKLNPFKWGSDLINGIANGIRSAAGAVQNAASWVAGKIRSFLHFSVPDEGPLADADTYGSDFMQLIADSIDENNTKPASATAKAAALISERLKQAKQSVLTDVKSLSQEESSLWAQETKALMSSSGEERKQLADEYEEKRYVIRQEIALRREQAVEEIEQIQRVGTMTKKELQAELEDRKQFASNVNSLLDEVKNALKEKYSEEEQAQEDAINKSLDSLENWKTQSEDIINSTYDAKEQALGNEANAATAALQAQLDALDKKDKADSRAETRKGYTDKISDLRSQIAYSHDAYNKAELQKQLEQEQADYQKELNSEATDDKKASLQDQINAVKDNLDAQKKVLESQKQAELNNITTVYNAKKKSLDNTLTAVKDTYSKMQEDAQLEAEAERMIVDKNQKGIIDLLNSYSDSYKLAGQTLGDKLAEGFKPAIDSIKAMIASINTEISDARASAIDAQAAADRIAATQSVMYSSNSTTRNNSYNISISSPVRQSPSEQTRQAKAAVQRLIFQTT